MTSLVLYNACFKSTSEGSLIGSQSLAISRDSITRSKAKWSVQPESASSAKLTSTTQLALVQ